MKSKITGNLKKVITITSLLVVVDVVGVSCGTVRAVTEATPQQTSQPIVQSSVVRASQTYGVLNWTTDTKVSKISGADAQPMTPSQFSANAPDWMKNQGNLYKMHNGDKFLITNIGIDDAGDKVSLVATITNSHEYKGFVDGYYASKDKVPIIMFTDQGIAKSASGKYSMSHGIAVKQNGNDGAEINYKFVKASDNKTPSATVTALSLYADVDALQAFTTTLLPSTLDSKTMVIGGNSNNAGHPNFTNIGFAKTSNGKPMIFSDYSGDVKQIGDGKSGNYNVDGFGFASNASYWQGTSFDYHFVGNARSLNQSFFENRSITIDKLFSGSTATFGSFYKKQTTNPTPGVYEYDLFGSTNYQPAPIEPLAPKDPKVPANPNLGVPPTAPEKPVLPTAPKTPALGDIKDAPTAPKKGVLPTVPSVPKLEAIKDAPVPPTKPSLPTAPKSIATPKLPTAPKAPEIGSYDIKVPDLPLAPTLKTVPENDGKPEKTVTDSEGASLDGKQLPTDAKFNYSITQKVGGKGDEYSKFSEFKQAVASWKANCEKIVADYQEKVKQSQASWDDDNSKVQAYLKAYLDYSGEYDKTVSQYNQDYAKYSSEYETYSKSYDKVIADYNSAWDKYASDFASYVSQYDKNSSEYNKAWNAYLADYKKYSDGYDSIVNAYNSAYSEYVKTYDAYSSDYDSKVGSYNTAWDKYVKDYQVYSSGYDSAVSDYLTKWETYSTAYDAYNSNYDTNLAKFSSDWASYEKAYDAYKAQWERYHTAYLNYKALGGKNPETALVSKKTKPTISDKVAKEAKADLASKEGMGAKSEIPEKAPKVSKGSFEKKAQEQKKEDIPEKSVIGTKAKFDAKASKAEPAKFAPKTPQEKVQMPDRPVAKDIKIPEAPSTEIEDYLYSTAVIKDSIDLSKVVLPDGTSTMTVVDSEGNQIDAEIVREYKDGKANITATLSPKYVQSDKFYNNSFSLVIAGAMFNIDDQTKSDEDMVATNKATTNVPTPTPDPNTPEEDNPQDTNEVNTTPEYNETGVVKEQSLDGKDWSIDPLALGEHDDSWQERISFTLSNHADYQSITLKDDWESVKRFETMKVTDSEGNEIEGDTEYLDVEGNNISKEFESGNLQKDGKQEVVKIVFHVKNPSDYTRAQGDKLKMFMTFTGVTVKGASGQEEVNYLGEDNTISFTDTAHDEWTDSTPSDGDEGKGGDDSDTIVEVLPQLVPNLNKYVVVSKNGSSSTPLESKGDYKPSYLNDSITLEGNELVARKEIKKGEQVTWAIVGTAGNEGLMQKVTDVLPEQFAFSPNNKSAFVSYVLNNDSTVGKDITDKFEFNIEGNTMTAIPSAPAEFFFVGSSTDSRYIILVNTVASEDIAEGTEFVNDAGMTTVNPKTPDSPVDNTADAKVHTPKGVMPSVPKTPEAPKDVKEILRVPTKGGGALTPAINTGSSADNTAIIVAGGLGVAVLSVGSLIIVAKKKRWIK